MAKNTLYQGHLTTIILKLLADNGRMYGYQITREVEKISSGELQLTEGALYPILHKLEARALLEAEMEKVNNRPRKYYKLTEAGKRETSSLLEEMRSFLQQMEVLVQTKPQTE